MIKGYVIEATEIECTTVYVCTTISDKKVATRYPLAESAQAALQKAIDLKVPEHD